MIHKRNEEIERVADGIDRVGEVTNFEWLVKLRPRRRVVLSKLDSDRPVLLSRPLERRSFTLEGAADDVELLVIREDREKLTCLDLGAEVGLQFLDFVEAGGGTGRVRRRRCQALHWHVRRGNDIDARHESSSLDFGNLFGVQSAGQEILPVACERGLKASELLVDLDDADLRDGALADLQEPLSFLVLELDFPGDFEEL